MFLSLSSQMFQDAVAVTNIHTSCGITTARNVNVNRESKRSEALARLYNGWVAELCERFRVPPARLADMAGLNPTTLTQRVDYDPKTNSATAKDYGHVLTQHNVTRLAERLGVRPPAIPIAGNTEWRGLAEPEAEPYRAGRANESDDAAIQALIRDRPGVNPWVLKSPALIGEGYLPGDILIVDLNQLAPSRGDIVCVQKYGRRAEDTETVFRVYHGHFVATATNDRDLAALEILTDDVVVRGTVIKMFRDREIPDAA